MYISYETLSRKLSFNKTTSLRQLDLLDQWLVTTQKRSQFRSDDHRQQGKTMLNVNEMQLGWVNVIFSYFLLLMSKVMSPIINLHSLCERYDFMLKNIKLICFALTTFAKYSQWKVWKVAKWHHVLIIIFITLLHHICVLPSVSYTSVCFQSQIPNKAFLIYIVLCIFCQATKQESLKFRFITTTTSD